MSELVLLIGVQGAGKSSFYKERFFDTHVRVSRDVVKTPARERTLIATCLATRQPYVVDNTNVLKARRAEHIEPAKAAGFRVVGFYFRTSLKAAFRRNAARPRERVVPPGGVAATFKKLQPPDPAEGFDELHVVEIDQQNRFVVREWRPEDGSAASERG